jgi:hypothetical protein
VEICAALAVAMFAVFVAVIVFSVTIPIEAKLVLRELVLTLLAVRIPVLTVRELSALLEVKLLAFAVVIFAVVTVIIPIEAKLVLRELVLTLLAVRIPVLTVRELSELLEVKLLAFAVVIFAVVIVTTPIEAKLVLRELVLTLQAVTTPELNVVVLIKEGTANPEVIPVKFAPFPKKLVANTEVAPKVVVLIADVLIRFV